MISFAVSPAQAQLDAGVRPVARHRADHREEIDGGVAALEPEEAVQAVVELPERVDEVEQDRVARVPGLPLDHQIAPGALENHPEERAGDGGHEEVLDRGRLGEGLGAELVEAGAQEGVPERSPPAETAPPGVEIVGRTPVRVEDVVDPPLVLVPGRVRNVVRPFAEVVVLFALRLQFEMLSGET